MTLRFLPSLKDAKDRVKNMVKDYFEPSEDGVRVRDFISNLPKAQIDTLKTAGQASFRGFAGVAAGAQDIGEKFLAGIDPHRNVKDIEAEMGFGDFTPTGKFQQDLFGTDKKITAGSFGAEMRGGLGGTQERRIDPFLGFAAGLADVVPGGNKADDAVKLSMKGINSSIDVYTRLVQKYGPTLAKKIDKLGDSEKILATLIHGGEEAAANFLNVDTVKVAQQKVLDAFDTFTQLRKETDVMRSFESSRRLSRAQGALDAGTGEQAFISAKRELGGEMPRANMPEAPRNKLSDDEVKSLFEQIRTTDNLRGYERFSAFDALGKVLGDPFFAGHIPTKGELKALEKAFGEPFARAVQNMTTTFGERAFETLVDIANVPRALMSSMDLSAPLRQGLVLAVDKPKIAARAFGQMFRYFADEKYFNAAMDSIHNSKMSPLREASGLDLTDVSGGFVSLTAKEEGFVSNLAAKIPGIGRLVKGSERAFAGFLNKLRADVFDDVAQEYMRGGMTTKNAPEEFAGLAQFINTATGRGKLSGNFKKAAPLLNAVFFSPRFMVSRLQMLNPAWYMKLPPMARKRAAKSMLKLAGTGATILSLASLAGADVETDMRSSDFAKMRFGNTRYDIFGGFQQWMVFATRLITGESKAAASGEIRKLDGKKFPFNNSRLDAFFRFFEGKFAPITALTADLMRGQTLIGEDVTVLGEMYSKLVPIYMQDLYEAARDEGFVKAAQIGVPALFGVGVQSFENKPKKDQGFLPTLPKLPSLGIGL